MIWATLDSEGAVHLRDERTAQGEYWALIPARGVGGERVVVVLLHCRHGRITTLCTICTQSSNDVDHDEVSPDA